MPVFEAQLRIEAFGLRREHLLLGVGELVGLLAIVEPAGEIEIPAIDGQHERIVQDTRVEPIRQDQLKSTRLAVAICRFLPFVDPGEAMPPPFCRLAD